MPHSKFERFLPWSGVIAGLAWIGQDALARVYSSDEPGRGSVAAINDHLGLNIGSLSCLVVMGVALLFFATAVRNLLRSGEAREATYSSVAYAGWITVSAALAQMAVWTKGLMSAAEDKNEAATQMLSYAQYFGWLGHGDRHRRRFHRHRTRRRAQRGPAQMVRDRDHVMGVLALLGACSIPPGGLVNYLLLPFWLIAAAVIMIRQQKVATQGKAPGAPIEPRTGKWRPRHERHKSATPVQPVHRMARRTSALALTVRKTTSTTREEPAPCTDPEI